MRVCIRCDTEMNDNYQLGIDGSAMKVDVRKPGKVMGTTIGKPKVAICPKCGEISIYIEDVKKL